MKDLVASVHRELSEKQSLAFNMTLLPTKLEFTTVSAENSFVFEFTSPDVRSNFEQAFEEAKKKLGQWVVAYHLLMSSVGKVHFQHELVQSSLHDFLGGWTCFSFIVPKMKVIVHFFSFFLYCLFFFPSQRGSPVASKLPSCFLMTHAAACGFWGCQIRCLSPYNWRLTCHVYNQGSSWKTNKTWQNAVIQNERVAKMFMRKKNTTFSSGSHKIWTSS